MTKVYEDLKLEWIDAVESELIELHTPYNSLEEICEEETWRYYKINPKQLNSRADYDDFYMDLYERLDNLEKGGV